MRRSLRMTLVVSAFVLPRASGAEERLVLLGGGDHPREAMVRFVEWAGGRAAPGEGSAAFLVRDGREGEVLGRGGVMVVDARSEPDSLVVTLVRPGRRFAIVPAAPPR